MPKTISLCGDGRGCKFEKNFYGKCNGKLGEAVAMLNVLQNQSIAIGCSAYEEKPLDKVGEFMEWYKKLQPTWGTCHLEETEAKLHEIFGGKE